MKSSSQALRNRSPSRSHLGYSDLPICICNITTFVQAAYQYKQNLFTIASTYFGNTEPSKQLPCIGYTILVDMTDGPDIDMRLVALELLLGHVLLAPL